MIEALFIPRRRIPVLLGKNFETKKKIESSTKTSIRVREDGDVGIRGELEGILTAKEIVKAIARGFSKEKALMLLDESFRLVVISLERETGKTIIRLMSRVIGSDGKAKRNIERATETSICVYGKTVSIIGESAAVAEAAVAIEDLLSGRKHAFVYSKLEKMKRLE